MLSQFLVFTEGGVVLYHYDGQIPVTGNIINIFIDQVLLARGTAASVALSTQRHFTHDNFTVRYIVDNSIEVVLAAVYISSLPIGYIDELFQSTLVLVREELAAKESSPLPFGDSFNNSFRTELRQLELTAAKPKPKEMSQFDPNKKAAAKKAENVTAAGLKVNSKKPAQSTEDSSEEDGDNLAASPVRETRTAAEQAELSGLSEAQVIANRLQFAQRRTPKGTKPVKAASPSPGEKPGRKSRIQVKEYEVNSFVDTGSPTASTSASPATAVNPFIDPSIRGKAGDVSDLKYEETSVKKAAAASVSESTTGGGGGGWGVFSSLQKMIGLNRDITAEDLEPYLEKTREQLIAKNVASEIAQSLCDSVSASLVGKRPANFTRLKTIVRETLETSLTRILSPKDRIDILRGVRDAQAAKRPYVVVFCGVNGVGKSTNLAKIAYWLVNNNLNLVIAACDTFRAGAVEQLKTHTKSLNDAQGCDPAHPEKAAVALFESGYGKDAADVAAQAIKFARETRRDVVLVDTAGRMQDNEPLMRSLAKLVSTNNPDLVLFVGEALVGNEAVDQLTKFSRSLADFSQLKEPRTIDGIVLTKFDTIDDKVGAAISMTYTSGKPIVFVGIGQTYDKLRNFNVKAVVDALLS